MSSHGKVRAVLALAACLWVVPTTVVSGQTLVFTPIDFPGAILTNAQGINAQGEIVGFYTDTAGRTHGFVQSSGHFRSIDYPGARLTRAVRGANLRCGGTSGWGGPGSHNEESVNLGGTGGRRA